MCNDPVRLNCNFGHIFCDLCISSAPHTVITTEPIYYDANNKSNELMVKENYAQQTQIRVTTTSITCPICKVSKCTKMACPMIAETICSLQVECRNAHFGCKWIGNILDFKYHLETQCINATASCPFAAVGCNTHNLTKQEYLAHIQSAQMDHLQLQINARTCPKTVMELFPRIFSNCF